MGHNGSGEKEKQNDGGCACYPSKTWQLPAQQQAERQKKGIGSAGE
jgi:hypothetical protein